MRPRKSIGVGAMILLSLGCGPDSVSAAGSDGETGDPTTGDGPQGPVCGNGVVEPGEACEPTETRCEECNDDCELAPLPSNEWALAIDPIVEWPHHPRHPIEIGLDGSVVMRGETMNAEPRVLGVTPEGVVVHEYGEAEHGFGSILDHAVGPSGELVLLGVADGITQVRWVDALATFSAAWPVPEGTNQVAVTEHGIATLSPGTPVRNFAFDGTPTWNSAESWERLAGVGGRLLMTQTDPVWPDFIDGMVEFIAGDGTDAITWDLDWGAERHVEIASTAPVLVSGSVSDGGDANATTFDLWTGEDRWWLLAMATDYLGVPATTHGLDARPDGRPVAMWTVCNGQIGRYHGCAGFEVSGVGHPDDPTAVNSHACDWITSLRVGPDDGVYLLSQRLDQSWVLVRRQTLE